MQKCTIVDLENTAERFQYVGRLSKQIKILLKMPKLSDNNIVEELVSRCYMRKNTFSFSKFLNAFGHFLLNNVLVKSIHMSKTH